MATTTSHRKHRDPQRERLWRGHIQRWRADGSTIRAYCRKHGLTETSFHFWRREIERRDSEPASTPPKPSPTTPPAFLPVVLTDLATPHETPVEIELAGTVVRVLANCDRGLLADIVAMLQRHKEARPC